MKYRGT